MTTQADYRLHEWNLILGAPGLIALVIIHADPWSERVAHQRVQVIGAAFEKAAAQGAPIELIRSVTDAVRAGQSALWPIAHPRDLSDVRGWALDACRQVAAILAQKAPEAEARAYAHWLMRIAQRVAQVPASAALPRNRLDGHTERQRTALEELAAALDVQFSYEC